MNRKLGIVGTFAPIIGLGISVYGYLNPEVPVCAPCVEGRPCPPCPAASVPDYTYFGIGVGVVAAMLVFLSLLWRSGTKDH